MHEKMCSNSTVRYALIEIEHDISEILKKKGNLELWETDFSVTWKTRGRETERESWGYVLI